MRHSKLVTVTVVAAMLTGCNQPPGHGVLNGGPVNAQDVGTAVGSVAGGVIGYQFGSGAGKAFATLGGALLGGVLGDLVGKSMDHQDMTSYDQASHHALETGQATSWKNPDSGNSGSIHPHKRYKDSEGRYCREYTQTILVEGAAHEGHGTACREDDGSWRITE
jgi:surface antigen